MGCKLYKQDNPSWKGGQVEKKCLFCDETFKVYPYREKSALYCSMLCKNKDLAKSNIGRIVTQETRNKLRKINTGRKVTPEFIEKMKIINKDKRPPSRKGVKYSKEERLKMSKRSKPIRGEKHPNWKGGTTTINQRIRKSIEYRLWREAVFERDNYTCVWCGKRGGELNADHIKPFAYFPELRFAIDNGRTLCVPCHKTTDTYGSNIHKLYKNKKQYEN
jgi:hypothetical protein